MLVGGHVMLGGGHVIADSWRGLSFVRVALEWCRLSNMGHVAMRGRLSRHCLPN